MSKRQAAFLLGKIGFAVGAFWVLFHRVDPLRVWHEIRHVNLLCVGAGLLLCEFGVVIAGWRWHRLLRIFDIEIPLRSLVCVAQIGQFFMMFLPGPTGDDLTRILYISRLVPGRKAESSTTVLIDRCVGLASVLLLAILCVPWRWRILSATRQTYWLALIILGAGVAACLFMAFFFLVGHPTHQWFEKRLRSLPAHTLRDESARIWGLLCVNKKPFAQVLAAALLTQVLLCFVFYFSGLSVGIHTALSSWMTFVPIVIASNAVPITIAGIGVREYLLVLFLGVIAGVDGERALAASFVVFAIILVICLSGGLLYIFYRPKVAA